MASATTSAPKKKAPAKASTQTEEAKKPPAKKLRVVSPKPRRLFVPGSLNDQISKLRVNESLAHVLRIPMNDGGALHFNVNTQATAFFKAKNSVLSGGIAKVRSAPEHKDKRFTMERGQYMTAGNDAVFALLTITRTE